MNVEQEKQNRLPVSGKLVWMSLVTRIPYVARDLLKSVSGPTNFPVESQ